LFLSGSAHVVGRHFTQTFNFAIYSLRVPAQDCVRARKHQAPGRNAMNRRNVFSLTAMTVLGLALLPGSAVAQQKTLKEQLVGAWTLASNDTTPPNGTKRQDFGANPKGILIFDAGGRYAVVQGRPDRPKFRTTGNVRLDTPAAEFGEA